MKLLVTTDFSANSKGAIRFAQRLAKQSKSVEVVFYHSIQIMKPTQWDDHFFNAYQEEEIKRLSKELKKFVSATLSKNKGEFADVKYIVEPSISTENEIMKFAAKNKVDFICIATQGAGLLRKIMGTHTSYIVKNSKIPVMVIPSHYRAKSIKTITYLSDFENLKSELGKTVKVASEISSQLEVVHYPSPEFDLKKFEKNKAIFDAEQFQHIKLNVKKNNPGLTFVSRISKYVERSKPELLIMFTKRDRGFVERIFLPSKSAELTYSTKVPVLIFSK